jgi:hypothetical protein
MAPVTKHSAILPRMNCGPGKRHFQTNYGRSLLTNWGGPLRSRPKWWGKLVIELIYDPLDPDVAEYLKNNKSPPGVHWHRQLTENYGARKLVSRCYDVVGMSKTCQNIRELRDRVAEHYGKEPVQLTLYCRSEMRRKRPPTEASSI